MNPFSLEQHQLTAADRFRENFETYEPGVSAAIKVAGLA